jgi:hypothetical protein
VFLCLIVWRQECGVKGVEDFPRGWQLQSIYHRGYHLADPEGSVAPSCQLGRGV